MNFSEIFNSLPWHDSELLNLEVDRSSPGKNDNINLLVRWPNGGVDNIYFNECYLFECRMNFGILAEESILEAECVTRGKELLDVRNKWKALGVGLDDLFCYRINTNSTNSVLKIYARSFHIAPFQE